MAKIKTIQELAALYKADPTKIVRLEDIGPLIQGDINTAATLAPPCCTGYKRYIAVLNQNSTGAPSANVLLNELGGTLTWSRVSPGVYKTNLLNAFPIARTGVFFGNSFATGGTTNYQLYAGYNTSSSNIYINTSIFHSGVITAADGQLINTMIEIRVF